MEARPGRSFGKVIVVHVDDYTSRKETRTCYGCGKVGYVKDDYCGKRTNDMNGGRRGRRDGNMLIFVG